jgi:hypothetical protein
LEGRAGCIDFSVAATGDSAEVLPLALKKEVICRWEGSAEAPANWRLVRGVDMM